MQLGKTVIADRQPPRVVKIGGSLLDMPDLAERLNRWIDRQLLRPTLVVVGGGDLVEQMRKLDQTYSLPPEFVHWQCVDLLRHTFDIVSRLLSSWPAVADSSQWLRLLESLQLQQRPSQPIHNTPSAPISISSPLILDQISSQPCLVNIPAFYNADTVNRMPVQLPVNWDTTSDSIAALLSRIVAATEIVLLKSAVASHVKTIDQASRSGVIDRAFPMVVELGTRVRIVNLRDAEFSELSLANLPHGNAQ